MFLASNLKKCKRSDEKFNECLRDAVQDALPKLTEGRYGDFFEI